MKKITKKILSLVTATSIALLCFSACINKEEKQPLSKTDIFMGTACTVKIFDNPKEKYIEEAFDKIQEIENKMSINIENSELIQVNNSSGKNPVKVSDESYYVIKKGKEFSELSEGKFDITIGPLVKLWGIGTESAKIPLKNEIEEKISLIDYKDIELDEDNKEVYLEKEGMIIDLGGIAKGYTADVIKDQLIKNGVNKAIINMGGNILVVGNKINGDPWNIGIQDPFTPRGNYLGIISVTDKSVVTSGIYERFLEQDGKRYHHILNPFTGYPWESNLAGISIISDKSIDGDALSTTVFSMGAEKGLEFVEELENIEAIFITKDKRVLVSSGIKEKFKLTNEEYEIVN